MMPCYHPLKGCITGLNPQTGKYNIQVKPYDFPWKGEYIDIPCGRCIGCRIEYSRQWANRLMMENEYHDSSYFITLTYSDEFFDHENRNIPVSDPVCGEVVGRVRSVCLRDWQLFLKRLRQRVAPKKLRFLACSEYGPKNLRPHYHAIIFGLELDDLIPWQRNNQGQMLFRSPFVEDVWSYDCDGVKKCIGFVTVAPVSWETCAYVARYVVKKFVGEEATFYSNLGIDAPWIVMSRRPGIGKQYLEDHPDCLDYRFIDLSGNESGRKVSVPRYFKKIEEERLLNYAEEGQFFGIPQIVEPYEDFLKVKDFKISKSIGDRQYILKHTGKSYLDYLADQEYSFKRKVNSLDRGDVDGDS